MADVFAVFGTLLAIGIAFPGLLTAWWLLFPGRVERARLQIERHPWRCFWLGLLALALLLVPLGALLAIPNGLIRLIGWSAAALIVALSAIGGAGIAAAMGARLAARAGGLSPAGAFVRGAVALELAAAFPLLGWFLVIPATLITALGATALALLPRPAAATRPLPHDPAGSQV